MITTQKQYKTRRRDATYKMWVEVTQTVKQTFAKCTDEEIETAIASYMQLMNPPDDAEEVTMSPDEVKQTGLLAVQCLSRLLYERSK